MYKFHVFSSVIAMEVLDGDDVRLTDSRGRVAERDIVQVIFCIICLTV